MGTAGALPPPQSDGNVVPTALTALPVAATCYTKEGVMIKTQLSSLSLPSIEGRKDGQYQKRATVDDGSGSTITGVNRYTITNGTPSASFIGYDAEGNELTATYSGIPFNMPGFDHFWPAWAALAR